MRSPAVTASFLQWLQSHQASSDPPVKLSSICFCFRYYYSHNSAFSSSSEHIYADGEGTQPAVRTGFAKKQPAIPGNGSPQNPKFCISAASVEMDPLQAAQPPQPHYWDAQCPRATLGSDPSALPTNTFPRTALQTG